MANNFAGAKNGTLCPFSAILTGDNFSGNLTAYVRQLGRIFSLILSRRCIMEGFILKAKDQLKLEVIYKILSGQMEQRDGQVILKVSENFAK
jgi:hypothetical protein